MSNESEKEVTFTLPAAPPARQGEATTRGEHTATCAGLKSGNASSSCDCPVQAVIPAFRPAQHCPNCENNSGYVRRLGMNNDEIVYDCPDHRPAQPPPPVNGPEFPMAQIEGLPRGNEPSLHDSAPPVNGSAPESDWSKFVPTEEIPLAMDGFAAGTVFAAWGSKGGSVRMEVHGYGPERLAGAETWSGHRNRIIRHADGRWADGYGPDGPVAQPAEPSATVTATETQTDEAWSRCAAKGHASSAAFQRELKASVEPPAPPPAEPAKGALSEATTGGSTLSSVVSMEDQWKSAEKHIADLETRLAAEMKLTEEWKAISEKHLQEAVSLAEELAATRRIADETIVSMSNDILALRQKLINKV